MSPHAVGPGSTTRRSLLTLCEPAGPLHSAYYHRSRYIARSCSGHSSAFIDVARVLWIYDRMVLPLGWPTCRHPHRRNLTEFVFCRLRSLFLVHHPAIGAMSGAWVITIDQKAPPIPACRAAVLPASPERAHSGQLFWLRHPAKYRHHMARMARKPAASMRYGHLGIAVPPKAFSLVSSQEGSSAGSLDAPA